MQKNKIQNNELIICLNKIRVAYRSIVALADISLDIYRGEFVGICGPNGSGKTTLLKTILGIVKPYLGKITIFGEDITNKQISKENKLKLGYVPQIDKQIDRNFPALVEDVVMMGRYSRIGFVKSPSSHDWDVVHKALKAIHMEKETKRPFGHLSGGQQQRVLIGRALAQEPEVLLMDEPTSALDFKMTEKLMDLVKELHEKQKLTIIMVNHNIRLLQSYVERLICLNHKLAYDGEPYNPNMDQIIEEVFFM